MSYDIEGVYSHEAKFSERAKENAILVGVLALHAAVTPVVLVAGATKSISNRLNERVKSLVTYVTEFDQNPVSATNQTMHSLPNQLLCEYVEVVRPEHPLISEAHKR